MIFQSREHATNSSHYYQEINGLAKIVFTHDIDSHKKNNIITGPSIKERQNEASCKSKVSYNPMTNSVFLMCRFLNTLALKKRDFLFSLYLFVILLAGNIGKSFPLLFFFFF